MGAMEMAIIMAMGQCLTARAITAETMVVGMGATGMVAVGDTMRMSEVTGMGMTGTEADGAMMIKAVKSSRAG